MMELNALKRAICKTEFQQYEWKIGRLKAELEFEKEMRKYHEDKWQEVKDGVMQTIKEENIRLAGPPEGMTPMDWIEIYLKNIIIYSIKGHKHISWGMISNGYRSD
jgi:hypothetical protein